MLKKIRIVNFASCKDVVLDKLGPMTVLVGRNGTGKTNILKALEWAARCATETDWVTRVPSGLTSEQSSKTVEMSIELEDKHYEYLFSFVGFYDDSDGNFFMNLNEKLTVKSGFSSSTVFERSKDSIVIDGISDLRLQPNTACLPALKSLLPHDHPALKDIIPLFDYLRGIRYDDFEEPNWWPYEAVISEADYQKWKMTGERSNRTILYQLLHESLTDQESFEELTALLGENGLRLIAGIDISDLPTRRNRNAKEDMKLFLIEFSPFSTPTRWFKYLALSLGTRRVIRILASVLFDKNSLTLGEQIEDGIHRGLARKLIGLLRAYSDPAQFILTTHSATVLNTFKPEEIRLVTMKDGETSVKPLAAREVKAAKRYIKEEGTLAEAIGLIEED